MKRTMIPNKKRRKLWNKLVKEVFNHDSSEYSIFVYELLKRRILGVGNYEYRATNKSDREHGINNIS